MNFPRITFIGGGNMARSILGGLLKKGFPADNLRVVEPNTNTALKLRQDFGISTEAQIHAELLNTDYVILATKPQIVKSVCENLGSHWSDSKAVLISIAAGIRSHSIASWLQSQSKKTHSVIRAMPNTPALIGLGASGLFSTKALDDETTKTVERIFSAIGISVWLDSEDQLDTVTAVSGSGPAYIFYMLECLVDAAINEGLSRAVAQKLIIQTALGASHMAAQSNLEENATSLVKLRERVTSKGGTTEAGIKSLQFNDLGATLGKAIHSAKLRSIELSEHASE